MLKRCPCGETPEDLYIIEGETFRWRRVMGNCCNIWEVEVRVPTMGENANPEGHKQACINGWNEATRGFE